MKIKKYLNFILIAVIIILIIIISIFIFNDNSSQKPTTKTVTLSATKKVDNTKSDRATDKNQPIIQNENAESQSTNQAKPISNSIHSTTTSMSQSTGDFSDIIDGNTYLEGNIEGDTIIIPLNDATIVNKQLILPEYYLDKLNEKFTLKVSSLGNNNFVMYESYNGVNTGVFNLKSINSQYSSTLSGTFSTIGSNKVIGIKLRSDQYTPKYPFLKGFINGTQVTFIPNPDGNGYFEKYSNDNNMFNLNFNYINQKNNYYNIELEESFNGRVTGEYELNFIDNNSKLSGVYIKAPLSKDSVRYPITLEGSYTP